LPVLGKMFPVSVLGRGLVGRWLGDPGSPAGVERDVGDGFLDLFFGQAVGDAMGICASGCSMFPVEIRLVIVIRLRSRRESSG
jgi:hypothetical protein